MPKKHKFASIKAMTDSKRSLPEKLADICTSIFGSIGFIVLNVIWFSLWIAINTGAVPGFQIFDPYPFGLLTTAVSLEAIMLTLFVLLSQNRAGRVADLRAEIDYSVDKLAEEEITKLLQLVMKIAHKHGIRTNGDVVLEGMLSPTNIERMEASLEKDIFNEGKN